MRLIVIISILFIVGCASVSSTDLGNGRTLYTAKCNGGLKSMADCYKLAHQTCPNGYKEMDKSQRSGVDSYQGNIYSTDNRELVFECK